MQYSQPSASPLVAGLLSTWPTHARAVFDQSGGTAKSSLFGKRILVVEDEFLLADEIADWLSLRGAEPVGPAPMLADARKLIAQDLGLDAAVLDINLGGTLVFPAALDLERRNVPLIFASAYADEVELPEELADKPRLKKPFSEYQLIKAVERLLTSAEA